MSAEPELCHSAKKTHAHLDANPLQLAWLFRVKAMASQQVVPAYSRAKLLAAVDKLKALTLSPEEVRHVPRILAEAGVRLVLVEPMAGSKMDGACFWLEDDKPVIGMTLRFDRIDNFWFVLRHEIEHVLREDGKANSQAVIDTDVGEDKAELPECERQANAAGASSASRRSNSRTSSLVCSHTFRGKGASLCTANQRPSGIGGRAAPAQAGPS